MIPSNPFVKIKSFHIDKTTARKSLKQYDLEKFRAACKKLRERALVEFFILTGCRISELINIKTEDINWTDRTVDVISKGNKNRTVIFSVRTKAFLEDYLKTSKNSVSINLEQQTQPINMILAMDNLIANATSYPIVAQGMHGSSQRKTITLSEECRMVIIQGGYDSHEWHICCVNGLSFFSGDGGCTMTSPTTVYLLTIANNDTSYIVYKVC